MPTRSTRWSSLSSSSSLSSLSALGRVGGAALALVGCAPSPQPVGADPALERRAVEAELHTERRTLPDLVAMVRQEVTEAGVEPTPPAPIVRGPLYALGQALAFDKVLSGNQDVSCMTCHHPTLGSDDDCALPIGVGGEGLGAPRMESTEDRIPRNAPALFNLHAMELMFWDGRVHADAAGHIVTPAGAQLTPEMEAVFEFGVVSAQAMFPVTSREEMRGHAGESELGDRADADFTGIWADLMNRLGEIPEYTLMFQAAYPGTAWEDMSFAHAANAIAAFEVATFESRASPWERFLQGDDAALSRAELNSALVFFDSGCASCHSGVGLSDMDFHNTGLAQFGPGKGDGASGLDDFGHERVSGDPADRYAFRTPVLTNVGHTAPYGHAGQYRDLEGFVDHYRVTRRSLLAYDPAVELDDAVLWDQLQPTQRAVLAGLAPEMADVTVRYRNSLLTFLSTLDEPGRDEDLGAVPGRVPSGLPVED